MVVTTEKRCAMNDVAESAASQMPITGILANARAASNPVSSKQAMTTASALSRSALAISTSRPGTAKTSS